jgi:peptidoglycan/xylan/chitin deacetylase (PgdA/CDA1 family)
MRTKSDRLVVCYHAISPGWQTDISVTPQRLAEQLRHLVERGYRGVTFSQAALGEATGRVVAITFDDGFASVSKVALPIMERLGLPGTVFLPTEMIGERSNGERMAWEDVRSLSAAGWEVGSHTKTHPDLTRLSDAELDDELAGSRLACERMIDRPCRSLAFPYGAHDRRVVAATERAGYAAAATAQVGVEIRSPLRCPRSVILRLDDPLAFRFKTSRSVRRLPILVSGARTLRLRRMQRFLGGAPA